MMERLEGDEGTLARDSTALGELVTCGLLLYVWEKTSRFHRLAFTEEAFSRRSDKLTTCNKTQVQGGFYCVDRENK